MQYVTVYFIPSGQGYTNIDLDPWRGQLKPYIMTFMGKFILETINFNQSIVRHYLFIPPKLTIYVDKISESCEIYV